MNIHDFDEYSLVWWVFIILMNIHDFDQYSLFWWSFIILMNIHDFNEHSWLWWIFMILMNIHDFDEHSWFQWIFMIWWIFMILMNIHDFMLLMNIHGSSSPDGASKQAHFRCRQPPSAALEWGPFDDISRNFFFFGLGGWPTHPPQRPGPLCRWTT